MKHILLVVTALWVGCGGAPEPVAQVPTPNTPQQAADAVPAIAALQGSRFDEAKSLATAILVRDGHSSRAAAVRALVTYQAAGHAMITRVMAMLDEAETVKAFDHESGRQMWKTFLDQLDAVDRDLAIVSADPTFSMELCLACWEHDWNRNGQIDDRDRKLFEIEYDAKGEVIDQSDPARRPTFRFDVGDADWARAMIAFQRAAVQLILAYRWSELDKVLKLSLFGNQKLQDRRLTIHLIDPDRVKRARELILEGVGHADRCREAYLAETDDDREWVPSPTQVSHPIPLPMDAAIYATWAGITGDVRRMMKSEEGLSLKEIVALIEPDLSRMVPDGYLDFGAMLREPTDIVVDVSDESETPKNAERILRGLFGHGYGTGMRPSPLVGRLRHMKEDLDRGADRAEHKLRYLLWLN
ncbi:hypothetical protein BH11MYX3_BH11MYX3_25640 [soil metagenome]